MLEDQIIKFLQPILDKYKLSWKRIITMPSISDDFKTISMLLKNELWQAKAQFKRILAGILWLYGKNNWAVNRRQ